MKQPNLTPEQPSADPAMPSPSRRRLLMAATGAATSFSSLTARRGPAFVSAPFCSVAAAGSSASLSGNKLTLTLNVTFTPRFAGNRIVYTAARDLQGGNSGWQGLGVWSVPGASSFLTAVSVGPARAAG